MACTHTPLPTSFSQSFDRERKMQSVDPQAQQATLFMCSSNFFPLFCLVCLFVLVFVPDLILSIILCGVLALCQILSKLSLLALCRACSVWLLSFFSGINLIKWLNHLQGWKVKLARCFCNVMVCRYQWVRPSSASGTVPHADLCCLRWRLLSSSHFLQRQCNKF